MNAKKLLAILLALATLISCVICFAACGKKNEPDTTEESTSRPSRTTAAAVSSQEDSMAKIFIGVRFPFGEESKIQGVDFGVFAGVAVKMRTRADILKADFFI